jgi:tyrosine-protein kinase Etk/Wzc
MPFRDILAAIWRRKLVVAVCVVVAVAGAAVYLKEHKPTYTSAATVEVAPPTTTSGNNPVNIPDPLVAMSNATVVANARTIAGQPLDAQVSGSLSQTSNLFTVTATGPTAAGAEVAANAYAKAYVAYVGSTVSAQEAKLSAAMASLNTTITSLEAQDPTGKNPGVQAQIAADSQTYATLGAQREAIAVGGPYASVQQPAGPGAANGSSKAKVGGVAVGAGLLAGIGIALIREQSDTRLRSEVDVAEVGGRPVLAELPVDDGAEHDVGGIAVVDDPQSLWSEAVRELRTSLRVLLEDKPGAVVLVTSPAPGDGKTTVAANLAAAWAMVDRRVVLVSADFRRPRVERLFGIEPADRSGLAQLARFRSGGAPQPVPDGEPDGLPSRSDVTDRLVPTGLPGLLLLPSGGTPRNPSELLDGPAMTVVLDHLADLADVVVLDAPPVLAVTDPVVLGRSATGVVVVVSEGKTDRHDLEATVGRLESTGATVFGMVVNRVRASATTTYHPYYSAED